MAVGVSGVESCLIAEEGKREGMVFFGPKQEAAAKHDKVNLNETPAYGARGQFQCLMGSITRNFHADKGKMTYLA